MLSFELELLRNHSDTMSLGEHLLEESWPVLTTATCTIVAAAFFGQWQAAKDRTAENEGKSASSDLLYQSNDEDEEVRLYPCGRH